MVHRILIVEDDKDIQATAVELVEGLGCVPIVVADGEEAIRWLARNPAPSLVLLDMFLPYVNGRAVLSYIEGEARLALLPVLAMTAGYGADSFKRLAAVLHKPFAPAEFCRLVLAHLRRPPEAMGA